MSKVDRILEGADTRDVLNEASDDQYLNAVVKQINKATDSLDAMATNLGTASWSDTRLDTKDKHVLTAAADDLRKLVAQAEKVLNRVGKMLKQKKIT